MHRKIMPGTLTNDYLTPPEDLAAQRLLERAIDSCAVIQHTLPSGCAIDPVEVSADGPVRVEATIRVVTYSFSCSVDDIRSGLQYELHRIISQVNCAR